VVPLPPQHQNAAETREIPPEQYETPYHDPAYYQAPRIETPTPANCGGSYGPEAIDWIEKWADVRLFPWQEHWLNRALEYDAETGDLLWGTCLISAPRQSGKSVGLRAMALWRLYQGERWGEQTVFHVSPNRSLSREIWKKAAAQVQKYDDTARVRWANGQEAIELPDDSQWILGAANETSAPGLSISLAVLDEAWAYGGEKGRAMLEEAIAPATLHRRNAQIFLVSTAGTLAAGGSNLLRDYRDRAIGEIATPPAAGSDLLIVEWSAPPDADMDDEATWRQAQAIWDPGRLERLRRERGRVKPAAVV